VLTGARDDDQLGLTLHGVNGSATPTVAGLAIQSSKKSGSTTQSFAAAEIVMQFYNGGTVLGNWYGSGSCVVGGLSVGYTGAPAASRLYIGDANFNLYLNSAEPTIVFDSGNDYMTYNRTDNVYKWFVGGVEGAALYSAGFYLSGSGIGLGPVGTGALQTGVLAMYERTDPAAPAADVAYLYAKDNGAGKTQIMAMFSSGAAQQVAIQP